MGKKSRKKEKQNKKAQKHAPQLSFKERIVSGFRDRNPILKFVLGFGILMAVFYSFWFTDVFINNVLIPVVTANAHLASSILNLFDYNTAVNGYSLLSPAFAISIEKGCDALEPMAIYLFAVFLFPASWRSKAIGIMVGIPILFAINQIRILSLFLIGVHGPDIIGDATLLFFDIMHIQVWQVIFLLLTLVLLAYWIMWALKHERSKHIATTPPNQAE